MAKDKHGGFLTPKAISARIKQKGLTRLRWYCQMCQKACRDENGFKCHCMSESHRRMMGIFANDPSKFMDDFSKEFESEFMKLLRTRYRSKRVKATIVYNEHIQDRHHIHMNSTAWVTLTAFVKYLGKEGKAEVDQDEDGVWYIKYIDRDPEALKRQEMRDKMEAHAMTEAQREERMLKKMIQAAKEMEGDVAPVESVSDVPSTNGSGPVKLSLFGKPPKASTKAVPEKTMAVSAGFDAEGDEVGEISAGQKRQLSEIDKLMLDNEKSKAQRLKTEEAQHSSFSGQSSAPISSSSKARPSWLCEGIVVKVLSKALAEGRFYKQKGGVEKVIDGFVAQIQMLSSSHKLQVDVSELETVIPSEGREVKFVRGRYDGLTGVLEKLHSDKYCCDVSLKGTKELVKGVEYEDISKVY